MGHPPHTPSQLSAGIAQSVVSPQPKARKGARRAPSSWGGPLVSANTFQSDKIKLASS